MEKEESRGMKYRWSFKAAMKEEFKAGRVKAPR